MNRASIRAKRQRRAPSRHESPPRLRAIERRWVWLLQATKTWRRHVGECVTCEEAMRRASEQPRVCAPGDPLYRAWLAARELVPWPR